MHSLKSTALKEGRIQHETVRSDTLKRKRESASCDAPPIEADCIHGDEKRATPFISELGGRRFDNRQFRTLALQMNGAIAGGTLAPGCEREICDHVLQAAAAGNLRVDQYVNRDFPDLAQALQQRVEIALSTRATAACHVAALRNFAKAVRSGNLVMPQRRRRTVYLLALKSQDMITTSSRKGTSLAGMIEVLHKTLRREPGASINHRAKPTRVHPMVRLATVKPAHRRKSPHPRRAPEA